MSARAVCETVPACSRLSVRMPIEKDWLLASCVPPTVLQTVDADDLSDDLSDVFALYVQPTQQ